MGVTRGGWVHAGAPWNSSGSFGVVGFTQVRPGGLWVHSGGWVHTGALWGGRESLGSRGFTCGRPGGLGVP